MTVKKQIEDLLHLYSTGNDELVDIGKAITLLEKLIAERPYEPGETILVGGDETRAEFLCVDPENPYSVWAFIAGIGGCRYVKHKPLPKTYRVTVPEEVIEDAKDARKAFRLVAQSPSEVKGFKALEWLANPENWEVDDE